MKSTAEIRQAFLEFFREREHKVVPSSPLVPANDPTLLFTNAGMVQFKDVFLGIDKRPYTRATTSQRCVRAGGKHNDLENVGYTARHHTFFEMLGNFSFGDYFKTEAIEFSWEFLTGTLGIPPERLWVTVYEDDKEAEAIWLNHIGVDKNRFSRCGEKDNFWSMGDTGPCGPCSEIFYDHGEDIPGGPPGSADADEDRYIEIWNLVFTQYDRNKSGELKPIPKPSVDTGMGLERIAAVMQGVHNNYDIDLFQSIIQDIAERAPDADPSITSLRVVADHIRSCSFLITDGVLPSNEGRGYVLRRIIRRAIRHGNKLGFTEPFFHQLVSALVKQMGEAYPELQRKQQQVEKALLQEEKRFAETLQQGLKHLEEAIARGDNKHIAGEDIFRLYDTYGFPVDLTADIARERNVTLDMDGFDKAMSEQRERARAASKFEMDAMTFPEVEEVTDFYGYEELTGQATVKAIYADGQLVNQLHAGESGGVILDSTPFYAESGGQVGDRGDITADGLKFQVHDTKKQSKAHIHLGQVITGELTVGQSVATAVDRETRMDTVRNHSATHLLHAALRVVLGEHVVQKGSLVAPDRLRFDFSHDAPLTKEELWKIESMVNAVILRNFPTQVDVMPLQQAIDSGAMSLFGEKYEDEVRVLTIGGSFSVELCGGTHVKRSGDIGLFKIINETGIAAGVRRIEAVSGYASVNLVNHYDHTLAEIAGLLKVDQDNVPVRLQQLLEKNKKLEKELEKFKNKLASSAGDDLATSATEINGVKVLAKNLENADPKTLRSTVDQLKNKLGSAVLVLATVKDTKVSLVAGVTSDRTDTISAGDLVNFVAVQVGGKGGGRPDMAQAGGNDPSNLDKALAGVEGWVRDQLG